MMIPILPELENREQWLSFLRRERPYAQVQRPRARVDLQSSYLQITLFTGPDESPLRYTLGAPHSVAPVWTLLEGCHWSLSKILSGLNSLAFSSNARDNHLAGWSSEMTLRQSRPNEPGLFWSEQLGLYPQQDLHAPAGSLAWVSALIGNGKYHDWQSQLTPAQLLISLQRAAHQWQIRLSDRQVSLNHADLPPVHFRI